MNSFYFAQYLLNEGKVSVDELRELIPKSVDAEVSEKLIALWQGKVTAEDIASVGNGNDSEFSRVAVDKELMTAEEAFALKKTVPDESERFAQVLIDSGKMDILGLAPLIEKYHSLEESPVKTVVQKLADDSIGFELPSYIDFVEIFLRSFMRFMETPAAVSCEKPIFGDVSGTHVVTQKLTGDISMVTGLFVSEELFIEMAKHYSHEDITEMDELAVDSLQEFMNVINGLFAVDMAKQQRDIDLETPRIVSNTLPAGNNTLSLEIISGLGSFVLMTATDEIGVREGHGL